MKKLNKIIMLGLVGIMTFSSIAYTGCNSGGGAEENNLTISFYEGGYGRKWLENCAEDFIEKKKSEGVEIKVTLDGQGADIDTNVNTYLSSGENLSDIYMIRTRSDWASDVTQSYLANLNSVYETEVEKLNGEKIKIKDYIIDEIADMPYMKQSPNQGKSYPWIMPWALLETSIIYNEDLLKATKRTSTSGNWEYVPKTMAELLELCDDINKANGRNDYGHTVSPFSWSQSGINYFQNIIYVLWAQYQGVDESKVSGEGSFYDFWNFETPDVWKQTGIQKAIDEWRKVIVDTNGKKWKNSVSGVSQKTFQETNYAFCNQESVMVLGGSFFENEMGALLDKNNDGKYDFSFKMMNIPFGSEVNQKNSSGENAMINFCSTDDLMLVPKKATNVELAKEFLAFMCNEKYLLDFTKETGCIRPFKYDPVELTAGDSSVKWSDFFLSCFNMKKDADFNIFTYPKNATNVSLYYTYYRPQLFQGTGVATACLRMLEKDGRGIMMDDTTGEYVMAKRSWNNWKINLEEG